MNHNVFIFEWLSGGGLWVDGIQLGTDKSGSWNIPEDLKAMLQQGMAMTVALASDLCRAGYSVQLPVDRRLLNSLVKDVEDSLPAEKRQSLQWTPIEYSSLPVEFNQVIDHLLSHAETAGRCLLIAPETDGCLFKLAHRFEEAQACLASPGSDFVQLASSKPALKSFLRDQGCEGLLDDWPLKIESERDAFANAQSSNARARPPCSLPLVVKPADGAGSESTYWVDDLDRWGRVRATIESDAARFFVEPYQDGIAASVAVLDGLAKETAETIASHPGVRVVKKSLRYCALLTPMEQCFDSVPLGHFVGARPLPFDLAQRAMDLAEVAVNRLRSTQGYYGIDLVLGQSQAQDVLLEVNPRLTMSYIELRKQFGFELAKAMIG